MGNESSNETENLLLTLNHQIIVRKMSKNFKKLEQGRRVARGI